QKKRTPSKSDKRFGFVRFIKVANVQWLVTNLCTIWVGSFRLQANVARKKGINIHHEEVESKPALVLDDSCLNIYDLSTTLMGKVKVFNSLSNLKLVLTNEGFAYIKLKYVGGLWVLIEFHANLSKEKFMANTSVVSWFSHLQQASNNVFTDKRITWLDIEGVPLKVNEARDSVMSSASSAVTYTSVYTDSEPGRVFWGADEELSDGEYPEYLALSDAEAPLEDQPLPIDASPTALSPGYMADSDPEEDPKEDHADYPADGGDDDDEPSDDDDEDESPQIRIPFAQTRLRRAWKTVKLEPHMSPSMEVRIAEYAAAPAPPSPPPSSLSPWSPLLSQIPLPPLPPPPSSLHLPSPVPTSLPLPSSPLPSLPVLLFIPPQSTVGRTFLRPNLLEVIERIMGLSALRMPRSDVEESRRSAMALGMFG
ncbi:hypothetical protein Tco_0822829, partial [Tanacetum coccineum]